MSALWHAAFLGEGPLIDEDLLNAIVQRIQDWNSDWTIDCDSRGYIEAITDEDGDLLWEEDWSYDRFEDHFSDRFLEWMNAAYGKKKSKLVIGKATKLPIPGARPSHS